MTKDTINFPGHVAQWKESGLSMAAYCKEQGFNYQTFTYHVLRMRKEETDATATSSCAQLNVPEKTSIGIEYHFTNVGHFILPKIESIKNHLKINQISI